MLDWRSKNLVVCHSGLLRLEFRLTVDSELYYGLEVANQSIVAHDWCASKDFDVLPYFTGDIGFLRHLLEVAQVKIDVSEVLDA